MLYATVRQRKIHVKKPETVVQNGIGVDELVLNMDDEWGSEPITAIWCVFTLRYPVETEKEVEGEDGETTTETVTEHKEVARQVLHTFGKPILVPWECLEHTGLLSLSCTGYDADGTIRMTTMAADSFWSVVQNGPMNSEDGTEPEAAPTPDLVTQAQIAAAAANQAAVAANQAAAELLRDKENGVFDGISPTVKVGTVKSGPAAEVENVGTPAEAVFNFTLPSGADGRGILNVTSENGMLVVRYTDGTSQSIELPGAGSWADLDGKPMLISNLAYDADSGVLTILYASSSGEGYGGFGSLQLPTAPVRGEDYWTEEDIAEIKGYVDEAILGGAW